MIKYGRYILDRIDKLSRRERLMVYAAAAVVVVFFAEQTLFRPLALKRTSFASTIAQQNEEIVTFQAQMDELQRQRAEDPDQAVKSKIKEVEADIEKIDARLRGFRQQLISPEEMVRVLETVIRRNRDVRVEAIRTLPAVAVVEHDKKNPPKSPAIEEESGSERIGNEAQPGEKRAQSDASLYKHGLEIVLGGNYADLARYMIALESAAQGVFWGTAKVDATAYPNLRLTLRVYTLSLESAFIEL